MSLVKLDRAAWARMKARLAEPRTVSVFKGRAVGQTHTGRIDSITIDGRVFVGTENVFGRKRARSK